MTHVGLIGPEKEELTSSIAVILEGLRIFFLPDYLGCSLHKILYG